MQKEDAPLAGMRAQGILKPLMLRRTKDSKLVGTLLISIGSGWSFYMIRAGGKTYSTVAAKEYRPCHIDVLS